MDPSKPLRIRKKAASKAKTTPAGPPVEPAAPVVDQEPSRLTNVTVELEPLDYMLKVINDDAASQDRRDRMAIAAAPFVHGKVSEAGVKVTKTKAAEKLGVGRFAPVASPKLVVNNRR